MRPRLHEQHGAEQEAWERAQQVFAGGWQGHASAAGQQDVAANAGIETTGGTMQATTLSALFGAVVTAAVDANHHLAAPAPPTLQAGQVLPVAGAVPPAPATATHDGSLSAIKSQLEDLTEKLQAVAAMDGCPDLLRNICAPQGALAQLQASCDSSIAIFQELKANVTEALTVEVEVLGLLRDGMVAGNTAVAGFVASTQRIKDRAESLQEKGQRTCAAIKALNARAFSSGANATQPTAVGVVLHHQDQEGAARHGAQAAVGMSGGAQDAGMSGWKARPVSVLPMDALLENVQPRDEEHQSALSLLARVLREGGQGRVEHGEMNREGDTALDADGGGMQEGGGVDGGMSGVNVWLYERGKDAVLVRMDVLALMSRARNPDSTLGGIYSNVHDFKSMKLPRTDLSQACPDQNAFKSAKATVNTICLESIVNGMCTLCSKALQKACNKDDADKHWAKLSSDVQSCATIIFDAFLQHRL